ncbi:hypothetical protein GALL_11160 [mine drainage metagenome]|uniref:Magnesium transporter MgtE intracellular domain-containing protein n=1 Tax=mine drainage metagenome TaxID=410659 RepID=A0A1J5TR95_9ZZZZ
MSRFAKTLLLVLLGLLLGSGTTVFVVWKAAAHYADVIAARRAAAEAAKKPQKPWDFWTVEIENLASDLRSERADVKKREDELDQREARLNLESQELAKTRKQIEAMRDMIDQRLVEVGLGEQANLKKLAQTYAGLSPQAAVAIFRDLNDRTVVKLMSLMKPDAVGAIFEEMSRESVADPNLARRAASITDQLRLIRVAKPPTTP